MTLPQSVTIGALTFEVTNDRATHNQNVVDSSQDSYGCIHYANGQIILDPSQNAAHTRYSLLHEVLHGCWHVSGRSHKSDEKAIRALCAPLLDVLRRNPELVAFLLEDANATVQANTDPAA